MCEEKLSALEDFQAVGANGIHVCYVEFNMSRPVYYNKTRQNWLKLG